MLTEIWILYTAVSTWTLEKLYKILFMFVAKIQHKILIMKNCNETNVIRDEFERFPNKLKMTSRRKDAQLLKFSLVHLCLENYDLITNGQHLKC
jgi:hypothetical protein